MNIPNRYFIQQSNLVRFYQLAARNDAQRVFDPPHHKASLGTHPLRSRMAEAIEARVVAPTPYSVPRNTDVTRASVIMITVM